MDVAAVLAALGVGTAVGSLLQHHLNRKSEHRQQRIETDRATYQERMTRLIAGNLSAFIRSDRCRDGEREELADLVQELSDGGHRSRFIDPKTHAAWVRLVEKSAECGWLRLSDRITEQDVAEYTRCWEEWMTAARMAFGPLPEADPPRIRRQAPARPGDVAA